MSWDTTGSTSTVYSNGFVRYYHGSSTYDTTATTAGNAFTYVVTDTNTITNMGYAGGIGTASTWGYSGSVRRGFAANDIRLVRNDFDSVKTDRKRKRAELKARRLFRRVVGEDRYQRFQERGFHEIVGKSGTRYRLAPGQWIKVMEEDEKNSEKIKHLLCAHLPFGVPWFDTMAIQHLMLTSSKETEDRFLKVANVHDVEGPYPIPELEVAA